MIKKKFQKCSVGKNLVFSAYNNKKSFAVFSILRRYPIKTFRRLKILSQGASLAGMQKTALAVWARKRNE
jgi:hypothetical protein